MRKLYETRISRAEWRYVRNIAVLAFVVHASYFGILGGWCEVVTSVSMTAVGMGVSIVVNGTITCFVRSRAVKIVCVFAGVAVSGVLLGVGGHIGVSAFGWIFGVYIAPYFGAAARVWLQRRFPPTPKQLREDAEKLRLNPAMAEGAPLGGKPASGRHGVTRRQRATLWRRSR